jgi:hypothetical protein
MKMNGNGVARDRSVLTLRILSRAIRATCSRDAIVASVYFATEVLMLQLVPPLALLVGSVSAGQKERPIRQLPPPTDIDPTRTEQSRKLEQQLCDAILRKDGEALDRLLAPEFTLLVADVPQSSLPRTIWMDNVERGKPGYKDRKTMERLVSSGFTQRVSDAPERSLPRALWGQPSGAYKIESIEQRHHAARKLAEDLAVVSLLLTQQATFEGRDRSGDFYVVDIWKKSGDGWQMIARYSSPVEQEIRKNAPAIDLRAHHRAQHGTARPLPNRARPPFGRASRARSSPDLSLLQPAHHAMPLTQRNAFQRQGWFWPALGCLWLLFSALTVPTRLKRAPEHVKFRPQLLPARSTPGASPSPSSTPNNSEFSCGLFLKG